MGRAAGSNFEALVREFVVARRRGGAAVRPAAERLAIALLPMIRGWVRTFRLPGGERVAVDDREDVVQLAFLRVLAAIENQRAPEAGRFAAAARTATVNCCLDHMRSRLAREKHLGGSLDERAGEDPEDPRGRYDTVVADRSREEQETTERRADAAADLDLAIEQIASDDQRQVMRLTLDGMPVGEIADRMGTSTDNVYQLRSRAMRRLKEALDGG